MIDYHRWYYSRQTQLCSTSPPPPGALTDGVGQLVELQVHSGAAWEVGEALSLGDVVLHLLQVGEQRRLRSSASRELGLLHGDADRALLQRAVGHAAQLRGRNKSIGCWALKGTRRVTAVSLT